MTLEERKNHLNRAEIRVLMLGAKRVGKTSLLALLSRDEIIKAALRGTELEMETEMSLEGTYNIMKDYFNMSLKDANGDPRTPYSELKLDDGQTDEIVSDYSMRLTTNGRNGTHKISFTDIPGEYLRQLENNTIKDDDRTALEEVVTAADVIIITIDSVLLMENEGVNAKQGNNIDEIYNLIEKCCHPQKGNLHKLFLFVPVKSEKYYLQHLEYLGEREKQEARNSNENDNNMSGFFTYDRDPMDKLIDRIEIYYKQIFDYLKSGAGVDYFQAAILPVNTLGDIRFKWFTEESFCKTVLDASDMRFEYVSKEDPKTHDLLSPCFSPEYCEQILVYILLFQLAKIREVHANKNIFKLFGDIFKNTFKRLVSDTALLSQEQKLFENMSTNPNYLSKFVQNPIKMKTRK